ncbi:hypothetical protein [Niabella drilacis]|uniref:DNA-directed RNA polymerase, subunit M/Transcription elongation factor TFIIS n=1 Tax=Niabella drilacis (strain DSM 25811 / CCM 8410 / CCUG 62505 / LMG 26954 / E90) TaxID=1285928 RepID=A0A1G6KUW2_NIADE|nr:hypothetical protein [Niabella drilacis]SDC34285.1 DNA-directed RNA polymerase, subunit M/Transcription elongation factor TFIIS [Niabella drilacis]
MQAFEEYPCPNCGSELNYDAAKSSLKCLHCGAVFAIQKSTEVIEERNISIFKDAETIPIAPIQVAVYRCSKCGQETQEAGDVAFFECRNCGNNVVNPAAYTTRSISPAGIIPFKISKQDALDRFAQWIGKGFWNDSDLKKLSLTDKLEGHYVPFWTFDCQTGNQWSGYSGRYYYETVRRRNASGEEVTEQVRHTNWTWRTGSFELFFDDVLVCGNKAIPQDRINDIYPYLLNDVVVFNDEYLLGWNARAYDKDLSETYRLARTIMDRKIEQEAISRLAEDTYRDLRVQTDYSGETFKQIILPVWLCQYLFKGKTYQFIINGQTGVISGTKPLSVSKIATAVVIAVLIIAAIYFFTRSG